MFLLVIVDASTSEVNGLDSYIIGIQIIHLVLGNFTSYNKKLIDLLCKILYVVVFTLFILIELNEKIQNISL